MIAADLLEKLKSNENEVRPTTHALQSVFSECWPICRSTAAEWVELTHYYGSIGSDNGLAPNRRQAIIWSNDDMLYCISRPHWVNTQLHSFNPSGAETRIFWSNMTSSMDVDVLVTCVSRTSAVMISAYCKICMFISEVQWQSREGNSTRAIFSRGTSAIISLKYLRGQWVNSSPPSTAYMHW